MQQPIASRWRCAVKSLRNMCSTITHGTRSPTSFWGSFSRECRSSGGDERLLVQGMEGYLLSAEAARQRDAAVLCEPVRFGRDQQYVLSHARREDARGVEGRGAGGIHVLAQGPAPHQPHQALE